jgi:hypothetical protein
LSLLDLFAQLSQGLPLRVPRQSTGTESNLILMESEWMQQSRGERATGGTGEMKPVLSYEF